jgi:hypothetical protein
MATIEQPAAIDEQKLMDFAAATTTRERAQAGEARP